MQIPLVHSSPESCSLNYDINETGVYTAYKGIFFEISKFALTPPTRSSFFSLDGLVDRSKMCYPWVLNLNLMIYGEGL